MRTTSELVNIDVKRLFPHPDNPRKDVGDVTELSESLKKNGVMQNLTVIPISALTEEPENQPEADKISLSSDFHVLIGHRRLAGGKLAELETMPCVIVSNLSRKEQIGIMLEENMQRSDLTILEQAQGFQMMLDLGETEDSIAEKTGFSKRTVKRRLNIAKLDQEELKKRQDDGSFQLSFTDLYELEKVESLDKRNEILKNARDSRDIAVRAQNAVKEAERKKRCKEITKALKKLGFEAAPENAQNEQYGDKWTTIKEFSLDEEIPEDLGLIHEKGMFYMEYFRKMRIIKKTVKPKKEKTAEELKKEQRDKNKKQVKAMMKELHAQVKDFVVYVLDGKVAEVKEPDLPEKFWEVLMQCSCISPSGIRTMIDGKSDYQRTDEEKVALKEKLENTSLATQMLIAVCNEICKIEETFDYEMRYKEQTGKMLLDAFELLEKYGWSFSDEDTERIVDGTYELYEKGAE